MAQLIIGIVLGIDALAGRSEWVTFLAGTGAILLTFLAGAELDPRVFRRKWREATVVGLIGFSAPFLGATAVARLLLGWDLRASRWQAFPTSSSRRESSDRVSYCSNMPSPPMAAAS